MRQQATFTLYRVHIGNGVGQWNVADEDGPPDYESVETLEVVSRAVGDPLVDAASSYARPFTALGDAVKKYREAVGQ